MCLQHPNVSTNFLKQIQLLKAKLAASMHYLVLSMWLTNKPLWLLSSRAQVLAGGTRGGMEEKEEKMPPEGGEASQMEEDDEEEEERLYWEEENRRLEQRRSQSVEENPWSLLDTGDLDVEEQEVEEARRQLMAELERQRMLDYYEERVSAAREHLLQRAEEEEEEEEEEEGGAQQLVLLEMGPEWERQAWGSKSTFRRSARSSRRRRALGSRSSTRGLPK